MLVPLLLVVIFVIWMVSIPVFSNVSPLEYSTKYLFVCGREFDL